MARLCHKIAMNLTLKQAGFLAFLGHSLQNIKKTKSRFALTPLQAGDINVG
jgi:hypothetical protein